MRFFAQSRSDRNGDRIVELRDTERDAVVTLRPLCGGTIAEMILATGSGSTAVLCANPDGQVDRERTSNRANCFDELFPGRMLWPFSDRIPRGVYRFEGQEYRLPINDRNNGDAIHGILYARSVSVDELAGSNERTHAIVRARIRPGEFDGYPFDVELELTYRLDDRGFELSACGRNLGGRPAPMSFGWHPYFSLPDTVHVDDLAIETNADRYVPVDARLLPLGSVDPVDDGMYDFRDTVPLAKRRIGDRELNIALTTDEGDPITTILSSKRFVLTIEQSDAFTHQQLCIPPSRNSLAVEPLTSATNAFNRPDLGLILLHHGEEFEAKCRITLMDR